MRSHVIVSCSLVICLMLVTMEVVSTAPAGYDYDNVRDLYEMLLQREALADSLLDGSSHRVVRKNNRSPSLRLRFGRRSDPSLLYQGEHNYERPMVDNIADN
ncbi:short neuropeptide F [Nilaparvata lugens]|uniref:Short neuropeptide F n=1 Tax=Nilaparvata lugens TaxID=108931 RepID=U3U456_NILLU|nr:short neuropeptide F [Nilaparvata lugens]AFW04602.1 short neuropeptide F [Nilaparvata lugens]BAO00976.1 short neuropeptide F [Nilaparvata lugens]